MRLTNPVLPSLLYLAGSSHPAAEVLGKLEGNDAFGNRGEGGYRV